MKKLLTSIFLIFSVSTSVYAYRVDLNTGVDIMPGVVYNVDATAPDMGAATARADRSIKDLCTQIGTSTEATLYLSKGDYVFSTTFDGSSYTLITLVFENGAKIKDDTSNASFTWGGKVNALPTQQIFAWGNGTGALSFANPLTAYFAWTGALADGSTTSTTYIQQLLDACPNGSTLIFGESNSTNYYKMGAVTVEKSFTIQGAGSKAYIVLSGSGAIGFQATADITDLTYENIHIVGDGVTGNTHKGFWQDGTHITTNGKIINCIVEDCIQNIDVNRWVNGEVRGCRIEDAAGAASGYGYGLVAGSVESLVVSDCYFHDNGRHGFYCREGNNVRLSNCHFNDHTVTAGGGLSAVNLIENKQVTVTGCTFEDSAGKDIAIGDDNTAGAGTSDFAQNYTIIGNVFSTNSGNYGGITIGLSSADSELNAHKVNITGNVFDCSPARENGEVAITSGFDIDIIGNTFYQNATTVQPVAITTTTTADAQFGRINVIGNGGFLDNTANTAIFFAIHSLIATGSAKVNMYNNHCDIPTESYRYYYSGGSCTNVNIKTDWNYEYGIQLAAGSQTVSCAGYNRLRLNGDAGASTVTNFTNGYTGKQLRIRLTDALVTIDRTNSYLNGGANFTSTNYDILSLEQMSDGKWYELYRSGDNS